jgi:hypothetical protein
MDASSQRIEMDAILTKKLKSMPKEKKKSLFFFSIGR